MISHQKAVLGCILADPEEAGKFAFAELDDASFPDPLCSKAFAIARDLSARELPIAADTVEAELIERHPDLPIDAISLRSFMLSVVTYIEGPWTVKYYVEKLKAATRSKDLARMLRQAADWAEAGQDYDGNPVGADDVADILREVVEERREHDRPHALPLGDLLESPPEKPRQIVGNGLICAGEGAVVVAEAKVGKSGLSQNLGISIAGGAESFLGHAIVPGRVLIAQSEVHLGYYIDRLRMMVEHAGEGISATRAKEELSLLEDGCLQLSAPPGYEGLPQKVQQDRSFLESQLDKIQPDLLVLDPAYSLLPSAESAGVESSEAFVGTLILSTDRAEART